MVRSYRSALRSENPTRAGSGQTGICIESSGVDVDEDVTRFGGPVPPMFWLRDPDGNSLIVVQPSA